MRVGFHASVSGSSLTLSKAYVPSSAEGKVHSSLVPSTHSFTFLTYLNGLFALSLMMCCGFIGSTVFFLGGSSNKGAYFHPLAS